MNKIIHYFNYSFCEKIKQIYRCSQLYSTDFSIISNNCWGGFIYQYFGLQYLSPTIGLFIPGNDFVKFCSKIKHYLSFELEFINWNDCRLYPIIKDKKPYPIAKLDDIEIYFMHYSSVKEAEEKWNRRKKRINPNRILYKLSQREGCSKEDIEKFLSLNLNNKICFSYDKVEGAILVPELKGLVGDEMPIISKYYNVINLINNIK